MPPGAGGIADGLEVEDFGDFKLGWGGAGQGADADDGGEVAGAAVEFGEEGGNGGGVGGWVDEDGAGLPVGGGEGKGVEEGGDLGWKGTAVVELGGDVEDGVNGLRGDDL